MLDLFEPTSNFFLVISRISGVSLNRISKLTCSRTIAVTLLARHALSLKLRKIRYAQETKWRQLAMFLVLRETHNFFADKVVRGSAGCDWGANVHGVVAIPVLRLYHLPYSSLCDICGKARGLLYNGWKNFTPKEENAFCFTAIAEKKGSYAICLVSYARNWSQRNMMWIRSTKWIYRTSELATRVRGNYWTKENIHLGGWSHFGFSTPANHERYLFPEVDAGE